MIYLWNNVRISKKVHILNTSNGHTFCKTENTARLAYRSLMCRSETPPPGRAVCKNCIDLQTRGAFRAGTSTTTAAT